MSPPHEDPHLHLGDGLTVQAERLLAAEHSGLVGQAPQGQAIVEAIAVHGPQIDLETLLPGRAGAEGALAREPRGIGPEGGESGQVEETFEQEGLAAAVGSGE